VTKESEGEQYVLASSLWPALAKIENVLAVHDDDQPEIAAFRAAMRIDHESRRVTLAQSLINPLHCLMHFLDARSALHTF
jgi:hypothetical protein